MPRMSNYWHPIATGPEVTETPRQFMLLGQKLVAFRHKAGVTVMQDLCIHRGAALSGGTVENGVITCPYHGWKYDSAGQCVHIPSLPKGASIPKKARALTHAVREAYGLVWVALEEPAEPFPGWTDEAWSNPAYRVFLVNTYDWNAAAGRATENAMDFAHFNFVHKGLTELADGPVIKPHDVQTTSYGLEYAYEDTKLRRAYQLHFPFMLHDKKGVIATGGVTWSERDDPKIGDATILSFIFAPVDRKRTRIYCFIARNHSLDKDDASFGAGFDTIMDQDRKIVESQRPELIPLDLREELHLKYPDAAAVAYRKMLAAIEGGEGFSGL